MNLVTVQTVAPGAMAACRVRRWPPKIGYRGGVNMTIGWFEAILLFVFWMYLRVSLFFHPGPSKKLAIWAKSTKRRSGLSLGGQESSVRTKGAKTWRALILIWNNLKSPLKHHDARIRQPAPQSAFGSVDRLRGHVDVNQSEKILCMTIGVAFGFLGYLHRRRLFPER